MYVCTRLNVYGYPKTAARMLECISAYVLQADFMVKIIYTLVDWFPTKRLKSKIQDPIFRGARETGEPETGREKIQNPIFSGIGKTG